MLKNFILTDNNTVNLRVLVYHFTIRKQLDHLTVFTWNRNGIHHKAFNVQVKLSEVKVRLKGILNSKTVKHEIVLPIKELVLIDIHQTSDFGHYHYFVNVH